METETFAEQLKVAEKQELALLDHENPMEIARNSIRQMLLLIIVEDLAEARFLWRRTAPEVKTPSLELQTVWAVVASLWERNDAPNAVRILVETEWSPNIAPLAAQTLDAVRTREANLIGLVYSCIPLHEVSHALQLSDDQTRVLCADRGWAIDAGGNLVTPVRPEPSDFKPNDGIDYLNNIAAILSQLTSASQ